MLNKKTERNIYNSDSFNSITVGLLSPEQILERSYGEVTKPEFHDVEFTLKKAPVKLTHVKDVGCTNFEGGS